MSEAAPPDSRPFLERFSMEEKLTAGGCLLAAILCLLPWFSASQVMGGMKLSAAGLDDWKGILVFVFSLATVVLVVGTRIGLLSVPAAHLHRLPLFGSALAGLFTLIYVATAGGVSMPGASVGKTLWPWLALVSLAVATWFAYQSWQASLGGPASPPAPTEDD